MNIEQAIRDELGEDFDSELLVFTNFDVPSNQVIIQCLLDGVRLESKYKITHSLHDFKYIVAHECARRINNALHYSRAIYDEDRAKRIQRSIEATDSETSDAVLERAVAYAS